MSLIFGTEFDHVTPGRTTNVQGQGHSVKTLSDRQIIALFQEIGGRGVTKSNGNVNILAGCYEMAVCAHTQYTISQKQRLLDVGRPQVAMHSQLSYFLVILSSSSKTGSGSSNSIINKTRYECW